MEVMKELMKSEIKTTIEEFFSDVDGNIIRVFHHS